MTAHTHEFRFSGVAPLSGSHRGQAALIAKLHPLMDKFEADAKALGLEVTIEDSIVKLGRGKKAADATPTPADPLVVTGGVGSPPVVVPSTRKPAAAAE
jgi:hypothetical protein